MAGAKVSIFFRSAKQKSTKCVQYLHIWPAVDYEYLRVYLISMASSAKAPMQKG